MCYKEMKKIEEKVATLQRSQRELTDGLPNTNIFPEYFFFDLELMKILVSIQSQIKIHLLVKNGLKLNCIRHVLSVVTAYYKQI